MREDERRRRVGGEEATEQVTVSSQRSMEQLPTPNLGRRLILCTFILKHLQTPSLCTFCAWHVVAYICLGLNY